MELAGILWSERVNNTTIFGYYKYLQLKTFNYGRKKTYEI